MTHRRLIGIASVLLAAALSVPALGADSPQPGQATANPARPGSLNYVEGQASTEGQSLGPEAIGKTELHAGQSLETQAGKAEVLLTPGVFFRLGDNSRATMISPTLTNTELRLDKGEATVEIAELHPENNVVIAEDGAKVHLINTGFYDFDANQDIVRVYQGEADVEVNGQRIKVGNEHQFAFDAGASIKPEKFDKEQVQDDLYRWSSLRSSYLAEANVDSAQDYQTANEYAVGWDWDPYYGAYTFIPGDGIFYSPFGWGFYSPFDVGFAPIFLFGRGRFGHDFDRDFRHFGDRGHFGEAHYYDHFDHGTYNGPGRSNHSGFLGGGVVAAGSRAGFHGGEGFHGGQSGQAFHGGSGSIASHGIGGFHGAGGAGSVHAGGAEGGFHGGGGGGFHGGGGGGGHR